MPIKLKKINNKWYTPDNRQYVGSAIQDRNIYWYGTDGSRTYLRRKGVYRPSSEIINYVKRTEAFSPTWYKDGNGHWTIGYGMKETSELRRKYPHSITKEQADAEFQNLANTYSQEMYQNTPNAQALNQNQLDALFSYYYNLGQTNYTRKSPAFQNALKSANWNEVINQMDFGYNDTKNPGLKKRRDYERQLFQVPVTIPKHYKGDQLIKYNINIYKQGENMKVKSNNQTKLIPRHYTGGLTSDIAEKFRKAKYAIKSNAAEKFRQAKAKYIIPNASEKFQQAKIDRFQGDSPESAILLPEIIITPQVTNTTKSAHGTRNRSGNSRTTAIIKSTPASTSTENTGTYTIQRGDTLGAIASNLGMSVDELARLNNISNPNRIYAGRILITKAPTIETPDIKVETPSVPNYGYGVTDSNLKLGTNQQYYPSYNQDELLRSYFSKLGLNFDNYKQLTADKLPTSVAPVSQEVKTFNPGNTIQTPSYIALRNAHLEDEALKRNKLLPFANQGTKLIRGK